MRQVKENEEKVSDLPHLSEELVHEAQVGATHLSSKHFVPGRKRSVTPRGRPGPGEGKKRKRKRKRERDRERLRRRGGLAESEKKVLEEENANMRAKLADR